MKATHGIIAEHGAEVSRFTAHGLGGVQARAANAIVGQSSVTQARIAVSPSANTPMANVAFWGAIKRTGWYAQRKYSRVARFLGKGGGQQHPKWIGNSWDVAVHGQGPYAINDALADYMPKLLDEYEDMIGRLAEPAFPIP